MKYNYDFWYQPRHNVMVSTRVGGARTRTMTGFNPEDVAAGKYGQRIHFWDWKERKIARRSTSARTASIPLEVRFRHDPDSSHGFVGAALSGQRLALAQANGRAGSWRRSCRSSRSRSRTCPVPVPGLITDILISMDDRFLYFSNWLHGDVRQYDISRPGASRS